MNQEIIQILKDLKKDLPVDVWKFKELAEQKLNCEFYYDESAVPERELEISKMLGSMCMTESMLILYAMRKQLQLNSKT
jgi:hypothetical protein